VRELEATLHRALVLSGSETLGERDFPWIVDSPLLEKGGDVASRHSSPLSRMAEVTHPIDPESYERILASVERDLIERALTESSGKIREASRRLGLARNTLKAKMQKYGLRGQDEVVS
jgi:DNA-binding NtrC family response regulator